MWGVRNFIVKITTTSKLWSVLDAIKKIWQGKSVAGRGRTLREQKGGS